MSDQRILGVVGAGNMGSGIAQKIAMEGFQVILVDLGEDPTREGLARTPERVARSLSDLTQGMNQTVEEVVGQGVFLEDCSEMIIVKDIDVILDLGVWPIVAMTDSGAYDVHPELAAPPGTKKLANMIVPPRKYTQ